MFAILKVFVQTILLIIVFHRPALAYLDPGTGSMMLQIILGGVAGLLVAGKLFWHRILVFLRIHKPTELEDDPSDEAEQETESKKA